MIDSEREYKAGVKELAGLIEREDSLDAAGLCHMSDLADALIAYEQSLIKAAADAEHMTATATAKAEYAAAKCGDRILATSGVR